MTKAALRIEAKKEDAEVWKTKDGLGDSVSRLLGRGLGVDVSLSVEVEWNRESAAAETVCDLCVFQDAAAAVRLFGWGDYFVAVSYDQCNI